MATVEEDRPMADAISNADVDASPRGVVEPENLKRKASRDEDHEASPKRARHDDDDRDRNHINRRSRHDSPPSRRDSHGSANNLDHDRRKSATQEEKKRGKRLFGGLLSTLSQTTGNSQHKRRLEIERRQQERLQKQKVEDDKERAEKRARLTEIRRPQQIVFEEEVMRNRHSKMLAMAKYLQTKSQPRIFYLPWKLTPERQDEIDEQIRDAKATIAKEQEAFQERKQRHEREYGKPDRNVRSPTPERPPVQVAPSETSAEKPAPSANDSEPHPKAIDKEQPSHHSHHHHDESADVLEEADEDMVIY